MKNRLIMLCVSVSMWFGSQCSQNLPLRVIRLEEQHAACTAEQALNGIGTIMITLEGAQEPVSYTVNNSPDIPLLDPVLVFQGAPGSYSFIITDGVTVTTAQASIGITAPLEITALDIVNNTCNQTNAGSITLTTQGGIPPIQFGLDGGDLTNLNTFTNVTAGSHDIRAVANDNCPPTLASVFVAGSQPPASFDVEISPVFCNGGSDGSIRIIVSGGVSPFEYSINGGQTFQTFNEFNAVPAGFYTVAVRDADGCVFFYAGNPVEITEPTNFVITNVIVKDVTGAGANNGSILVQTNSTDPQTFTLNGQLSQSSPLFTNLSPGTYTILVVKNETEECAIRTVTVGVFDFTTTILTEPTCPTGPLGSIRINVTGGTTPFAYSIDNGVTFQASPLFTGLLAGVYQVVVRDALGSTITHAVSLGKIIPPTGNPITDFIINRFCRQCVAIV